MSVSWICDFVAYIIFGFFWLNKLNIFYGSCINFFQINYIFIKEHHKLIKKNFLAKKSFFLLLISNSNQNPHISFEINKCSFWCSLISFSYHLNHLACSFQLTSKDPVSPNELACWRIFKHVNLTTLQISQEINPFILWLLVKLWVRLLNLLLDDFTCRKEGIKILFESLFIALCQSFQHTINRSGNWFLWFLFL